MHQSMKWINEIYDRFFYRAMKLLIERCHIGLDRYNCGQLSMFPFPIDWICGRCSTQKIMPYQYRCEWYDQWVFETPTLKITQPSIIRFYQILFINCQRFVQYIFFSQCKYLLILHISIFVFKLVTLNKYKNIVEKNN